MNELMRIYYNYFKKKTNLTIKTKKLKTKKLDAKKSIKIKKNKLEIPIDIYVPIDIHTYFKTNKYVELNKKKTNKPVNINNCTEDKISYDTDEYFETKKYVGINRNEEIEKYNIEKNEIEKVKINNKNTQIILKIIMELINNGFIIYGDFCKKILNNICKNEVDICCTLYQYIYFGNISLYELSDEQLCKEFINYLKITLKNFDDNFVEMRIMKSRMERYIILYYNMMKINIRLNMENIIMDKNFICDMVKIQKKNINKNITIDDFSKCILMDGRSDDIVFTIGNYDNISIVNVIKSIKMKYAYCFHKYKIYKNKIIFYQMCYSGKSSMCLKFPYICNVKNKENVKNGICPCKMNIFIKEFINTYNNGYVIILGYKLKVNYDDIIWPQSDNEKIELKILNNKNKKKEMFLQKPKNLYMNYIIYEFIKYNIDKYKKLTEWSHDLLPPSSIYKPNYILMPYYGYKIILCDEFEIYQNNISNMKMLVNKFVYHDSIYYQTIIY